MKIHVEMTEEEMNDFLLYRKEKSGRTAAKNRLTELAQKILWAVGSDNKEYVIMDQDHAEDLVEMAAMYVN